jgi:ABC-type Fe3+/spermidine/putrescine transport system ATPase subunit
MDQGHIVQQGAPEQVYDAPSNAFVASFMGAENSIDLLITPDGNGSRIAVAGSASSARSTTSLPTGAARAYFREDAVRLVDGTASSDMLALPGRIVSRAYPGGHYRYGVDVGGRHYVVKDSLYRETEVPVTVGLAVKDLHMFRDADVKTTEGRSP